MHIDFSDCLHIPLVFQSSCLQFLRIVKLRGKFQGFLNWCGSYICWCYFGSEAERESNISILALSVCHWKWGPYFFGMMHVTWLTDKTHVLFSAIRLYEAISLFLHFFICFTLIDAYNATWHLNCVCLPGIPTLGFFQDFYPTFW